MMKQNPSEITEHFQAQKAALKRLMEGNKRFANGLRCIDSLHSAKNLKKLAVEGQKPWAVVVSCSDSRAPSEIIFDSALGELFVIRVAGNVIDETQLASIEFAVSQFSCPLLLVMGHTECGAINTTLKLSQNQQKAPSRALEKLVDLIRPSAERCLHEHSSGIDSELLEKVTLENAREQINRLGELSSILDAKLKSQELLTMAAVFDLHTGIVKFDFSKFLPFFASLPQQHDPELKMVDSL